MRLEKKDIALVIPATLLAIAGLGPDDPWVIGPCIFFSWLGFLVICYIHEGSAKLRAVAALVITLALSAVAYRRFGAIYHTSPHLLESVRRVLNDFGNWIQGPHGRWFDKLLGVVYTLVTIFVLVLIAAIAASRKRRQAPEKKGFLDYKFDTEKAMLALPSVLEKLTDIMRDVGPALNKHTADLLRANSTAGQLRVSKQVARSLNNYSARVDRVRKQFNDNGILLSEGLLGWTNWIKSVHPSRSALGVLPEMLKQLTETIKMANHSLGAAIGAASSVKGASRVLNEAVDRYVASWNAVLQTNHKIFEACSSALEVFNTLS